MTTWSDSPWPGPIVFGQIASGDLVFVPEAYAVAAAGELDQWRAAGTWGEARALAEESSALRPPFHVDDLEPAEDGDAPFVVADQFGVADGDWPPMTAGLSLDLVTRHWASHADFGVGVVEDTVFNGPMLQISSAEEAALVSALERAGCTVRRDDELIRRTDEL